jgi:hypothetical protein
VRRFYLEEQDKHRICDEIGLTLGQFDKVVFRARRRVKSLLQAKGFSYGDFLPEQACRRLQCENPEAFTEGCDA